MFENPKIWMERTHSRKGKCKTEFKGVVNKVLVTSLILTTVLSTTSVTAHASNYSLDTNSIKIAQEYRIEECGISVEAIINSIRNTIAEINSMKNRGIVSSSKIEELANELYDLEKAVHLEGGKVTQDVKNIVTQAEKSIAGVKNASKAEVALKFVKSSFGMDSVTVTQKKANALKSFSDVPTNHWAYSQIMNMAKKGVIAGTTTPDANGVGTFAPDAIMTRAQFVTVVTRYLYANELAEMTKPEGSAWYHTNYNVAVRHGIIKKHEFGMGDMNVGMTRQEMAMVLVRACKELGESIESTIKDSRIPDYDEIGGHYRDYVLVAYSKGMIAGTDKAGTFNPKGTLTRAQAATVLNRLIEPSTRQVISAEPPTQVAPAGTSWVEGQAHKESDIKVGATVIKKDGTKVVLEEKFGVIGFGSGCDIYSGTVINGVTVKEGMASRFDNTPFRVSDLTGECYSVSQWGKIRDASRPIGLQGDYDGEVYNIYWKWDANWFGPGHGDWVWMGEQH